MSRKLNFPAQQQPDVTPTELSAQINAVEELRGLSQANTESEIAERLDFFFDWCAQRSVRPTVSLMCLALGHPRQTLWTWQKMGGAKGKLITEAKAVIEALLENWMVCGKVNPVSGIFILKANFGWKDTTTVELATEQTTPVTISAAEAYAALDVPYDE